MRKRGVLLFCIIIFSIVCTAVLPVWADGEKVLAFPGAEGGGKYAMGARASENPEVYHVTTLESNVKEFSEYFCNFEKMSQPYQN